ncbi:hypothetical protein ACF06Q_29705 [Streptomyces leeuwenhoekii]|uniref:hypothetical protein n=1 Tax=Streptomyces leeuwenhoekii TaxID=1437453 RepID=UPI0036FFFEAE
MLRITPRAWSSVVSDWANASGAEFTNRSSSVQSRSTARTTPWWSAQISKPRSEPRCAHDRHSSRTTVRPADCATS